MGEVSKIWEMKEDVDLYKLQPHFIVRDLAKHFKTSKEDVRARIKLLGLRRDFSTDRVQYDRIPKKYFIHAVLTIHGVSTYNKVRLAVYMGEGIEYINASYRQVNRSLDK
ncbi:hypothetical protein KMP12_06175 [Gemella sp. zg-1178]|nr:hypothetical protein [Gemella sp. zg-1178]